MTVFFFLFFFSVFFFQHLDYYLEPEHIYMLPCHEKAGAMRILRIHVLGDIMGSSSLG